MPESGTARRRCFTRASACALRVLLGGGHRGGIETGGRIARCENTIPRPEAGPPGTSRRDFLRGSGLAAATAVLTGPATAALDEAKAAEDGPKVLSGDVEITLKVNGEDRRLHGRAAEHPARHPPQPARRDRPQAGLRPGELRRLHRRSSTATPVYSCTTLAVSCQGKTIETLESFDTGEKGVPHAFHQNDALMCGYCTPGFVTACKALLDKNPNPTLEEVRKRARRQHLPVRDVHRRAPGGPRRGQSDERSLTHGPAWPENPRLIGTEIPRARRPGQGLRPGQVSLATSAPRGPSSA